MSSTTIHRPQHRCRPHSIGNITPVLDEVVECDHCQTWWRWTAPGIGYHVHGYWKRMGLAARLLHHIDRLFARD